MFREADILIHARDGEKLRFSVDDIYPVPYEDTFDIRIHIAEKPDSMNAVSQLAKLRSGDVLELTGPLTSRFYPPISGRRQLVMIAANCQVDVFRPLVKKIYDYGLEWMGDVRIFFGDTGLQQVYLNRVNQDLLHYYDESAHRAFDAVMSRSLPTIYQLADEPQEKHIADLVSLAKSTDSYFYVVGQEIVLQKMGQQINEQIGDGQWQQLQNKLVQQGHWYHSAD